MCQDIRDNERVIIRGENVTFSYNREKIFDSLNFAIYHKEFLGIIGPNGGGKTTFVKILLGILTNYTGKISYPNTALLSHVNEIGYVPQNIQINLEFPIMVVEIVEMGLLSPKTFGYRVKITQRKKALEILEKLGISDLAYVRVSDLSGGQRQRVFIARAMISDPALLILDEPTSNIDPKTQAEIYKLLKKINEFHTIITVSHNIPITLEYATRILHVNRAIYSHENPRLIPSRDGHMCEVDIFQDFARSH